MSIEKAIEHLEIVKNFIELEDKSNALHFIKLAMFKLEKQKERIAELEEEKADCFIALNEGKPDITGGCNLVEQIKKLIEKNKQYIDRIAELEAKLPKPWPNTFSSFVVVASKLVTHGHIWVNDEDAEEAGLFEKALKGGD